MEKIPLIEQTFSSDKKSITLRYPNVRFAKENHLLLKKHGITQEMIEHNMTLCGFNIVSYGEFRSIQTKITTRCSNIDCNDTNEKTYLNFIYNERYPLCKDCQSTVLSINISNKRPIVAIKGDEQFEFKNSHEAARQLGFTSQTVYHCVRNGKKHSSGYRFEFLD
ncbi:hypothetical protein [Bacillus cereus]|uniref:hypothetical protein n=1 Tax=Bacillus cereus TaxID=1396 RepID=UPI000BFD001F|nr:hypothetical protein [Bacillus cereus]PGS52898.1 hypothetical protein COC66_21980 [Bacillus cereus]